MEIQTKPNWSFVVINYRFPCGYSADHVTVTFHVWLQFCCHMFNVFFHIGFFDFSHEIEFSLLMQSCLSLTLLLYPHKIIFYLQNRCKAWVNVTDSVSRWLLRNLKSCTKLIFQWTYLFFFFHANLCNLSHS